MRARVLFMWYNSLQSPISWLAIAHYSLALICPLSREVLNGWRRLDQDNNKHKIYK